MSTRTIYSVDTSALIDGLERYYPLALFPALWVKVDELIDEGRLIISEEVWEECRKKDAATKDWCDNRNKSSIVVNTDAKVATEVRSILQSFPKIVSAMKNRNRADPFVIAVAKVKGAVVITGEGDDGSEKRPKIPFICHSMNIKCYRFIDLVKLEGWSF